MNYIYTEILIISLVLCLFINVTANQSTYIEKCNPIDELCFKNQIKWRTQLEKKCFSHRIDDESNEACYDLATLERSHGYYKESFKALGVVCKRGKKKACELLNIDNIKRSDYQEIKSILEISCQMGVGRDCWNLINNYKPSLRERIGKYLCDSLKDGNGCSLMARFEKRGSQEFRSWAQKGCSLYALESCNFLIEEYFHKDKQDQINQILISLCDHEIESACFHLAIYYETNDEKQSQFYFKKACTLGNKCACQKFKDSDFNQWRKCDSDIQCGIYISSSCLGYATRRERIENVRQFIEPPVDKGCRPFFKPPPPGSIKEWCASKNVKDQLIAIKCINQECVFDHQRSAGSILYLPHTQKKWRDEFYEFCWERNKKYPPYLM